MDRINLSVGGTPRSYLLFVPGTHRAGDPLPLVVFLHGAGGTAEWADEETGWSALAARDGFALALPEGTPPHPDKPPKFLTNPARWNDGSAGPTGEPAAVDDIAFLAAVIDHATTRTAIDLTRVYVSGFSNGAGMVFRAATELAPRVAAVAPVAGYCWVPDPKPARPVPTLYVIGTADPLVPVRGGEVRSPWRHRLIRRLPVAETLERWAVAIGCRPVPELVSDTNGVRVEMYPGPIPFRAVYVAGLGHHWPGGLGRLNHKIGGLPSDRYSATAAVWEFFRQHTL